MGANGTVQRDASTLQRRADDARDGRAVVDRTHRRKVPQEHTTAATIGPSPQDIVGERLACLLHERHGPVASALGAAYQYLRFAPANILEDKRAKLLVADARRGQQQEDGTVAATRRGCGVDDVDRLPDICPNQLSRQVRETIGWRSRHEPRKIPS